MLVALYSSPAVMPSRPMSPTFFHRSAGNSLTRSISAARGAISASAKAFTASRSMLMSSPRPKSRLGMFMWFVSVPGLFFSLAMHDHDGLLHQRAKRFLAVLHREHLGLGDDQRAARAYHLAAGDQLLAVGRGDQVHLVLDSQHRSRGRNQRHRRIAGRR